MSKQGIVTVGGQQYDAVTGLPVQHDSSATPSESPVSPKRHHDIKKPQAATLHQRTQRSTTLNRKFTKKPQVARTAIVTHSSKPAVARQARPVQHHQVRKFAPHPVGVTKVMDIGPTTHPHVAKAHALSASKEQQRHETPSRHIPATEIKQQALTNAVAQAGKPTKERRWTFWQQRQRAASIVAATFALVLLGGYVTYLNMPSLSVRVAAAQAGINASYPNYRPDGYALSGPVTYADGRVSMHFKANSSDAGFTVNQSKSGWDSDAVLDNYVSPRAGSSYMPYTERGLKIYTYNNNAAWVNGGVLYTIEGDAPLSSEQIRRIATSLL